MVADGVLTPYGQKLADEAANEVPWLNSRLRVIKWAKNTNCQDKEGANIWTVCSLVQVWCWYSDEWCDMLTSDMWSLSQSQQKLRH